MFILAPNAFLEKEMATHCSVLAWKIPWTEEPGCCSPWGLEESDTTERLTQPRKASLAIIAIRHKNSQNSKMSKQMPKLLFKQALQCLAKAVNRG